MKQIRYTRRKVPEINSGTILSGKYMNKCMVREIDATWNQFLPSLLRKYEKLVELGLRMSTADCHLEGKVKGPTGCEALTLELARRG